MTDLLDATSIDDELAAIEAAFAMFPGMTHAEALAQADSEDVWIVPGLISATTTLVYGEAKIGKSWLVSSLIGALVTGGEFLGQQPEDRPYSVGVFCTDDRGTSEYSGRVRTICPDVDSERLRYYSLGPTSPEVWDCLATTVRVNAHNVVVIDNLSQSLERSGSINDDVTVRAYFEGVRELVRAGIAVVIVGHSTDKTGVKGRKPTTPMGSAMISQSVRWRLFVERTGRNLRIKSVGNVDHGDEMTVRPAAGARFTVLSRKSGGDAAESRPERSPETLDKNAEIAHFVVDHCQGLSQSRVGQMIAENFDGITASTAETHLSRKHSFGAMLSRDGKGVDTRWSLSA